MLHAEPLKNPFQFLPTASSSSASEPASSSPLDEVLCEANDLKDILEHSRLLAEDCQEAKEVAMDLAKSVVGSISKAIPLVSEDKQEELKELALQLERDSKTSRKILKRGVNFGVPVWISVHDVGVGTGIHESADDGLLDVLAFCASTLLESVSDLWLWGIGGTESSLNVGMVIWVGGTLPGFKHARCPTAPSKLPFLHSQGLAAWLAAFAAPAVGTPATPTPFSIDFEDAENAAEPATPKGQLSTRDYQSPSGAASSPPTSGCHKQVELMAHCMEALLQFWEARTPGGWTVTRGLLAEKLHVTERNPSFSQALAIVRAKYPGRFNKGGGSCAKNLQMSPAASSTVWSPAVQRPSKRQNSNRSPNVQLVWRPVEKTA